MALIKCKSCGHVMSDRADFCPHCGCPKEFSIKEETSIKEDAQTKVESSVTTPRAVSMPENFSSNANNDDATVTQDIDGNDDSEENTANRGLLGIVGILTIIAFVFASFLYSGNRYYNGKTFKFIIDTCTVDTDSCNIDTCAIDSLPNTTSSEHDFISFDDLMVSEPSNECHYDIRGIIEVKKALQQKGYELVSTQRKDIEMEGDETVECVYYTYVLKTSDGDILNKVEFESPINGIGVDNISITFADNKDKENFVEQIHNSNYVETDRVGEVGIMWGDKHTIAIYYNGI